MSEYIYNPNVLYHYGVLGMKWGIRRATKYKNKQYKQAKKNSELYGRLSKVVSGDAQRTYLRMNKGWTDTMRALTKMKITETTTKKDISNTVSKSFVDGYRNATLAKYADGHYELVD